MPSAEEIRAAKEADSTRSVVNSTSYNPGHVAGFAITFEDEQPYIAPGAIDVFGRKVLRKSSIALAECNWRIPKMNSYQYYLYIDRDGTISIDNQLPIVKEGFIGLYHPLLAARNLGSLYVNEVGRYMNYSVVTLQIIGYSGEGTPYLPAEGDKRIVIVSDEIRWETYTAGAWVVAINISNDVPTIEADIVTAQAAADLANSYTWPSDSNLIAYYPMDGDARDKSNYGNDGTLTGFGPVAEYHLDGDVSDETGTYDGTVTGTEAYETGKEGQAFTFDGASSINTGLDDEVDNLEAIAGKAWSVSTWVKNTETGATMMFVGRGGGTGASATYGVFQHSTDVVATVIKGTTYTSSTSVNDGEWHHVVTTWDGTTGFLYIDRAVEEFTIGTAALQTSYTARLGATATGAGVLYTGALDDTRFFTYALSAAEISSLYNRPQKPSHWVDGVSGKALSFNDKSTYITIADGLPSGDMSLSLWLKAEKNTANRYIYFQDAKRVFYIASNDNIYNVTKRADGVTNASSYIPSASWAESTWIHIVAIQSGLTTSMYLNGGLIDSDTHADIYTSFDGDALIGYTGASNWYDGLLDDIRIYNRALTEAEISTIYKYKTKAIGDLTQDAIEPVMANFPGAITIGFRSVSGSTTYLNPGEGDRRTYIDEDEIRFQEYTDSAWTTVNQMRMGGTDSNGVFISGVSCRQVVNPLADEISQEFFPSSAYQVFDFEGDYKDQNGNDTWTSKSNLALNTTIYKRGGSSLTGTTNNLGLLGNSAIGTVGSSQSFACYHYITAIPSALRKAVMGVTAAATVNEILLYVEITTGELSYYITKNTSTISNYVGTGLFIETGKFQYLSMGYNATTDTLYVTLDGDLYLSGTLGGTWGAGTWSTQFYPAGGGTVGFQSYFDEIVTAYDLYTSSDLYLQHYNHNIPWNTDYSAKDLILRPADGGSVNLKNSPTTYYAPVSGEESFGTFHSLDTGAIGQFWSQLTPTTGSIYTTGSLAAYLPSDAKAVELRFWTAPNATAGGNWYYVSVVPSDYPGTLNGGYSTNGFGAPIAYSGAYHHGTIKTKIGADYKIKIFFGANCSVASINCHPIGYYI